MYDDVSFGDLVKNEIRIGKCYQTAYRRIVGAHADMRMRQKQVYDGLYPRLNTRGTLG